MTTPNDKLSRNPRNPFTLRYFYSDNCENIFVMVIREEELFVRLIVHFLLECLKRRSRKSKHLIVTEFAIIAELRSVKGGF